MYFMKEYFFRVNLIQEIKKLEVSTTLYKECLP